MSKQLLFYAWTRIVAESRVQKRNFLTPLYRSRWTEKWCITSADHTPDSGDLGGGCQIRFALCVCVTKKNLCVRVSSYSTYNIACYTSVRHQCHSETTENSRKPRVKFRKPTIKFRDLCNWWLFSQVNRNKMHESAFSVKCKTVNTWYGDCTARQHCWASELKKLHR